MAMLDDPKLLDAAVKQAAKDLQDRLRFNLRSMVKMMRNTDAISVIPMSKGTDGVWRCK